MSTNTETSSSDFTTGLAILLVAQCLSAFMGAYTEDLYAAYNKASWTENLFYSHFLSLPLFLPMSGILRQQYSRLAATPALDTRSLAQTSSSSLLGQAVDSMPFELLRPVLDQVPRGVLFLTLNAVTQLACISGVNLLSAKSSAVTVTIVLNVRKLVSFIFSTILFGHDLSFKMALGSTLVFGSGALYGWETSWRLPQESRQQAKANGSAKKTT